MKFELKPYQEVAAAKVLSDLRKGSQEYLEPGAGQEFTAASLSAPTGSGKTVIATAVIERMLFGDPDSDADPEPQAMFLWLTDDPALNEQTRSKMLQASDRLQPGQLVTIDEGFDQPRFDPGKVYFLNIQKMGVATSFVVRADGKRRFPLWETISSTIRDAGGRYYLVIDEAHRGTGVNVKARQTIAQTLISGQEGLVRPAPVVWGISATPQRFDAFIEGSGRLSRKCEVPTAEVRESGLIKDVLSLTYQGENQEMELALVRQSVRELKAMDEAWNAYTGAENAPSVRPALVLQLPAKPKREHVGELLDVCAEEWPELTGSAVAHAMESHTAHEFGGHTVKYVAPQDVQDHPTVRLVLFKEALTTGWDCPRAEVMLSLRGAKDYTYIAQLIGRMVRSPLARRIESDEALNRVSLFLPGFAVGAVEKVKEQLEADPEAPPTDVQIASVNAPRNKNISAEVFGCYECLPSYVVPGPLHRSQVSRLHKLASLLVGDDLLPDAIKAADHYLVRAIDAERVRLKDQGDLAAIINDVEVTTIAVDDWAIHSGSQTEAKTVDLATDAGDLDRMFAAAKRRFKDGLAERYWGHRVTTKHEDPYDAKALVIALSRDTDTVDKVEAEAASLVKQWLDTYGNQISGLSEDRRARYQEVRAMAKDPEVIHPTMPTGPLTMPSDPELPTYTGHLYADRHGNYCTNLGTWEERALAVEQNRPGFVAWYRNPTGGQRCLRIPYKDGDTWKPLYPDLVVFHRDDSGEIRPSVVDPHGHHLADAGPKLRGLADYAVKHSDACARIIAVIRNTNGDYRMLDLTDTTIQTAVKKVTGKDQIEALFNEHGAAYG